MTARARRQEEVLAARLRHVRCAVQHVHHRHNVSAILRTCDALGVHGVHLVGDGGFRASVGPARGADRWLDLHHHTRPEDAVAALKDTGFSLWVADLAPDALPPEEVPLDRPVCLWLGAEVLGVHPVARAAAEGVVSLPMHGFAQSLNVSVAAGMLLRPLTERARARGPEALLPPAERAAWLARWQGAQAAEDAAMAAEVERLSGLGRAWDQGD